MMIKLDRVMELIQDHIEYSEARPNAQYISINTLAAAEAILAELSTAELPVQGEAVTCEDCAWNPGLCDTHDATPTLKPSVNELVEKDAARYRWLRHADLDELAENNWGKGGQVYEGEELDAAIDAAIASHQSAKGEKT
jgi:hypothetical protein